MRHTFELTVFLFQFMSLHADRWCGGYDSCRSVLVTRQVITTLWVNCFCHGSVYWALSMAIRSIDQMGIAPVISLSLFIFGLMTCSTAATFFRTYSLFRPILLRSVRVVAHVFCCAGMFGMSVRRYCCGFRSMSLKSRLSNSKLQYYFLVPYFGF